MNEEQETPKTLAQWRAVRGLTQMELAVRAGTSLSTVVNVETARQDVSINMARKLAAALGVTLNDVAWPQEGDLRRRVTRPAEELAR